MNTRGTVSERLRQLEAASRLDNTTVAVPGAPHPRPCRRAAPERVVAALEEHYAVHGELRAIEDTLARLETEAGQASSDEA